MSTINLHQSGQRAVTCISNTFIDHYMAKANGEYVKIYLYLLRKLSGSSCELSIADIADRFDHTEKDILRSLYYWEKMNLLSLEYFSNGELCGIRLHEPKKPAEAETSASHSHSSEKSSAKKSSTRKSSTSAFDIPAL